MPARVRVRFAPSPTGFMHLGNVRAALFNYLFAKNKNGTFVLRIEDTDVARNLNEATEKIYEDLAWLGLHYQEGPVQGGHHGPYAQSERTALYEQHLLELVKNQRAYRCFCTVEELDAKRQRQIALKKPPRYDRTCLHLSDDMVKEKLAQNIPFIWRLRVNHDLEVEINTLERGVMRFDMQHFSDFALTRADGSVTFIFANFVDDWQMLITHVIRGEDHLTNTAMQGALYDAFFVPMPVFWHLPMICNAEGKKLSKRDFGFSLDDLRNAGYVPEAICNYLANVGHVYTEEIQSLDELAASIDFDNLHSTGAIRYDLDKLLWTNHQWIMRLAPERLLTLAKPFLVKDIPAAAKLSDAALLSLLAIVKSDLKTLADVSRLLSFYFNKPVTSREVLVERIGLEKAKSLYALLVQHKELLGDAKAWCDAMKQGAKQAGMGIGELWSSVRYLLTGEFVGMQIHDLLALLSPDVARERLLL